MPQSCILFYANYTILVTQRGGPWHHGPPPKYAPAQRYSTSMSTGIICRPIAVVWLCILQRWQRVRIGPGSYCFVSEPDRIRIQFH